MNAMSVAAMIVERQPTMLVALSSALSAGGINVIAEMKNTGKLIQTAKMLTPDLIIYSVREPTLVDFQIIATLRQEIPLTSILALVDDEANEKMEEAKKYGADMVLPKATPRFKLLDTIERLCEVSKDTE